MKFFILEAFCIRSNEKTGGGVGTDNIFILPDMVKSTYDDTT